MLPQDIQMLAAFFLLIFISTKVVLKNLLVVNEVDLITNLMATKFTI